MNPINTDPSVAPVSPSAGRATPAPRASSSADGAAPVPTKSASSGTKSDQPKPARSPDELALQMNRMLEQRDSQIRFEIDRTSHPAQIITQIVDKNTKEVLRQFPSEDMIRLSASMDDAEVLGWHDVALVKAQA